MHSTFGTSFSFTTSAGLINNVMTLKMSDNMPSEKEFSCNTYVCMLLTCMHADKYTFHIYKRGAKSIHLISPNPSYPTVRSADLV